MLSPLEGLFLPVEPTYHKGQTIAPSKSVGYACAIPAQRGILLTYNMEPLEALVEWAVEHDLLVVHDLEDEEEDVLYLHAAVRGKKGLALLAVIDDEGELSVLTRDAEFIAVEPDDLMDYLPADEEDEDE